MRRLSVPGLAALKRWLRPRSRPAAGLAELGDHMLADIGLRRDQIVIIAEVCATRTREVEHLRRTVPQPGPDSFGMRPAT